MYKAITVEYSAKAKKMAAKIEEAANRMEEEGYELISVSMMPSAKGILIFRKTSYKKSREKEKDQDNFRVHK